MTRANINFIYSEKGKGYQTLYFYQNGDQYPTGLRDMYHVEDFLNTEWKPEDFKNWVKENYKGEPQNISHPCIYYDNSGFITDWSYVFDRTLDNEVRAYNWDKLVFSGTREEFRKWIKEQV